jgi:glyoxylase-like metal-dependent hydrolase (beta-lactamase superfamily II)
MKVTTLLNGYLMTSDQGNPAFCGAYLVEREGRRVLFDCGHVGRRRMLLSALSDRGLEPADIDTVVLSHGHWDHLQNVDLFERARVLVHGDELRYLEAPRDLGTPRWAKAVLDGLQVRETGDGDQLIPGVEVVHLPGHTPGSIGLAVTTDTGVAVLTGDAIPTAGVLLSRRSLGVPLDAGKAEVSFDRVAALADVVYPGHDRPFRLTATGEVDYPAAAVPVVFRVPDPAEMEAGVRFIAHHSADPFHPTPHQAR